MRDGLTSGMQTAVAAQAGTTAHLMSLEFSGGTIEMVTLPHDVVWDSKTWVGVGGVLGFEPVEEGTDLKAASVTLRMSGVDQTIISALLGQNYRGRAVTVYRVKFDSAGAIVADPLEIFTGKLNAGFEIRETRADDARSGEVEITTQCVSDLAVLAYSKGIKTNLASHQAVESGDTFFQNVNSIPDVIWWGSVRSNPIRAGQSPPGGPQGPEGLGWH